jgi:hypothetical protein
MDVPEQRRKIRTAILVVVAVAFLSPVTCAYRSIYFAGRTAQESADGAALAGLLHLRRALQEPLEGDDEIVAEMLKFATLNGLDGRDRLAGYYLDSDGKRLGRVGTGLPEDPRGIEAVVTVRTPSLLTRVFGLAEWSVTRQSRAGFEDHSLNMDPIHE